MCKDSNEDEWIYVVRTGSCRVIKALTQVTPKLKTRKKAQVIYDNFGTKRISQYGMEALGMFSKVRKSITLISSLIFLSRKHRSNLGNVIQKLNKFDRNRFL
jgi:hypothetical protein